MAFEISNSDIGRVGITRNWGRVFVVDVKLGKPRVAYEGMHSTYEIDESGMAPDSLSKKFDIMVWEDALYDTRRPWE